MDVSKLEKQADILFNNISGWNTNALKRIGRRVKSMKSLSYADLQAINNATIVNQDVNAIMEELAKLTQQNVQDVYKIYGEMISEQHLDNQKLYDYRNKPFVPFSKNKELQALVKAYARTTAETFVGLTMTKAKNIGFVDANNNFVPINKQFKTVLDKATVSIATGTGDFGSEMRDVLKELGGSGLRVDYGGGVTRRLDTMVRQNLLWGAKQASVEYNNMIGEELGCDGIEIDWHSNPRPSHEFMQGKQYILGKAKTINGIYFESADRALEALQDYGCLHFSTPIICGVSEPAYSPDELKRLNAENKKPIEIDGVTKTGYEWKQTMRRLETEARKTKDQKEILKSNGDNIGANQLDYKLKAIKSKYNLIAKETGIKAQPEKMAVIKSAKTVDKYSKSGIIKEDIKIYRGIGASGKNYPVKLPNGNHTKFAEGTTITKIKVIMGEGTDIELNDRFFLESEFKISADKWQKVRGEGFVVVDREIRKAELHWYEADGYREKVKVKEWLDES